MDHDKNDSMILRLRNRNRVAFDPNRNTFIIASKAMPPSSRIVHPVELLILSLMMLLASGALLGIQVRGRYGNVVRSLEQRHVPAEGRIMAHGVCDGELGCKDVTGYTSFTIGRRGLHLVLRLQENRLLVIPEKNRKHAPCSNTPYFTPQYIFPAQNIVIGYTCTTHTLAFGWIQRYTLALSSLP